MNEHVTIDQPPHGGLVPHDAGQLPTRFEPEGVAERQAKRDAIIAFAKRVQDWPLLEQATDEKLDELAELIGWWDANVGVRVRPGRQGLQNADLRSVSKDDAQHLTGFTQQQVSRFRKDQRNREAARERIMRRRLQEGARRGRQGSRNPGHR